MLRVDVSKKFSTAASSQEGEFVTSITTEAPFSASARPSPVMLFTPVLGAAARGWCPCSRNFLTSHEPISPVPPIITIFMKIVIIGGTGLIGSWLVKKFREHGHQPLAAAPNTGVNSITGEGLADALNGASVVIDVTNSPSWEDAAVLNF